MKRILALVLLSALPASAQSKPPLTLSYSCGSGTAGVLWSCSPTVTNGTPPYKFTITYSGDLPPTWVTIDPATGVLSGTPPYSFTLAPNAPTDLKLLVTKLEKLTRKGEL
jgi:hypothetical protein